jgi:hypothetical protein
MDLAKTGLTAAIIHWPLRIVERLGTRAIYLSCGVAALASCSQAPQNIGAQGIAFREEILSQWHARQKVSARFLSDFEAVCRATFIGLSLDEANEKLYGSGRLGKFFYLDSNRVPAPPGMVAVGGGFGIHSSIISGTTFNIVLFVDLESPSASPTVREVSGCVVRDVSL